MSKILEDKCDPLFPMQTDCEVFLMKNACENIWKKYCKGEISFYFRLFYVSLQILSNNIHILVVERTNLFANKQLSTYCKVKL